MLLRDSLLRMSLLTGMHVTCECLKIENGQIVILFPVDVNKNFVWHLKFRKDFDATISELDKLLPTTVRKIIFIIHPVILSNWPLGVVSSSWSVCHSLYCIRRSREACLLRYVRQQKNVWGWHQRVLVEATTTSGATKGSGWISLHMVRYPPTLGGFPTTG